MSESSNDKKAQRNVKALRGILWDQIELLKINDPKLDLKRAELTIKAADSIIKTMALELHYAEITKKKELEVFEDKEEEPPALPAPAHTGGDTIATVVQEEHREGQRDTESVAGKEL